VRLLLFLSLTVLSIVFADPVVAADSTKLKLRVLPLNCIFDVIDVGTQELEFLTPEECGVEVLKPIVKPQTPIQTDIIDSGLDENSQISFLPSADSEEEKSSSVDEPGYINVYRFKISFPALTLVGLFALFYALLWHIIKKIIPID